MEPNHSHSIKNTEHSRYEKKQPNDGNEQILAEVFEVNLVLHGQNSCYCDAHSYKYANSQEFEKIACRMLTGKFEVPQNEKVMVTLTKCIDGLIPIAEFLAVLIL